MNKLKILNTVALLVVVATPISQASVFDDMYEATMEIADQRDEVLEQRNKLIDYVERLETVMKENNKYTDEVIDMLISCQDRIDESKKGLR